MDRYMTFNVVGFLRDSKDWIRQKQELTRELTAIPYLSARSDSVGHGSGISDNTSKVAQQRETVQKQIDRISLYQEALRYGRGQLTQAENDVIDVFFKGKGGIAFKVQEYGTKYGYGTTEVYKHRRLALEKLARVIESRYFE